MKQTYIVADTGWAETVPEWMFEQANAERLVTGLLGLCGVKEEEEAVDMECVIYLMTAIAVAPPSHLWVDIYLYLCTKVMKRVKNIDIPEDLRVDELDEYKQMKLKELRKWIFRQRGGKVKHDVIDAFKKVFVNSPPPQTAG